MKPRVNHTVALSLRWKATLATLLLLAVALSAAWGGARRQVSDQILMQHKEVAESLAQTLALSSEVALFTGDTHELQRLLDGVVNHADVAFAEIINVEGRIVASAVHNESSANDAGLLYAAAGGVLATNDRFIFVQSPVYSLKMDDLWDESEPSEESASATGDAEVIGHALVGLTNDGVRALIQRRARSLAILFIVVAATSAPLVWLAMSGWTKRLAALVRASEKISHGELDYDLTDQSRDEIGRLSVAFNEMRQAIHARDLEMKQFNAKLQDEVQSRTVQLEHALAEAQEANRAKSNFLANMSHEIRTPMTAILGYADLLQDPEHTQSDRLNSIQTIKRSGDHLLTVINDILDLSKIEAGKFEIESISCEPPRIIAEVASLMRARAEEKGLRLNIEYIGSIPKKIVSDPTRIRQILVNLVGNSIKFTRSGGVRIIVSLVSVDGKPKLRLSVADTGIGMTEEQLAQVFRPFTQADETMTRRFGGTGLGLAISRRLSELLGGALTARSMSGEGSEFTVIIDTGPIQDAATLVSPEEALSTESRRDETEAKKLSLQGNILLAEDGRDNQRLISFHLRKAGAEVEVAENGRIAVDMAQEAVRSGRPFDMILMDMQMPELDGYSATKQLRDAGFTLPIVALTAHAMVGDRERCIDAGCDDYLTKPISGAKLIGSCRSWIERGFASKAA